MSWRQLGVQLIRPVARRREEGLFENAHFTHIATFPIRCSAARRKHIARMRYNYTFPWLAGMVVHAHVLTLPPSRPSTHRMMRWLRATTNYAAGGHAQQLINHISLTLDSDSLSSERRAAAIERLADNLQLASVHR